MRLASIGLAPYRAGKNFDAHIPNKPIEYLSAGLPVVTSIGGELAQLLNSRQCGFFYQERNIAALTAALTALYDDRCLQAQMSANASVLFADRFVAETVYGDMADHLERIALSCRTGNRRLIEPELQDKG
jgi:glycosyltransferase involved in cell wall biosynthesis